jgi:hypothetical protein
MKTNSSQQEILLVTGTTFSSRQFYKSSGQPNDQLTEKEKLEAACRDGLLPGLLPEIFEEQSINKKMFLWKMREGSLFIELKSGKVFLELEMEFSIDPYSFLAVQILS